MIEGNHVLIEYVEARYNATLIKRLHKVAQYGNREDLEDLFHWHQIPEGCYTKDDKNYPIHTAVMNAEYSLEVVSLLLEKGVKIDKMNRYETTPLHLALQQDHCNIQVVELLLRKGADVRKTNISKSSPLHFAVQSAKCKVEVLDMLLENGAEIDGANCVGDSPLLRAVRNPKCTVEIVQHLLDHGANISLTNDFGRSVTHSMVETKNFDPDVLKLLLQKKAPLDHLNVFGRSPLCHAIINRCNPIGVRMLLDAGALLDNGNSVFENAVDILENSWCEESMSNLGMLMRYATLQSFDYDIDRYIRRSKFFVPLSQLKNQCVRDVLKMESEVITNDITLRDFLSGRKRVRFNDATEDGELCDVGRILHVLTPDKYPVYRSIIISKLDMQDVYDNLQMYSRDSENEFRKVVLYDHGKHCVARYLSDEDVLNLALAFHTADVCNMSSIFEYF